MEGIIIPTILFAIAITSITTYYRIKGVTGRFVKYIKESVAEKSIPLKQSIKIAKNRCKLRDRFSSHAMSEVLEAVEIRLEETDTPPVTYKPKDKIFLGGTCNNTTWRDELIPHLNVNYFNPVVEDWTPECQEIEEREKSKECNIHLYVITKEMKGVFSIAEAVESATNKDKTLIFAVLSPGFDEDQLKSLQATANLLFKIDKNCITVFFNEYFNPKALNEEINSVINNG